MAKNFLEGFTDTAKKQKQQDREVMPEKVTSDLHICLLSLSLKYIKL